MSTVLAAHAKLPIEELDALLAQHPFGDSQYITQQMHLSYQRRLRKISVHLPIADQLLDALSRADTYRQYRFIGDTVLRCAVQHAHKQVETGTPYGLPLEQCAEVFQTAIRFLEENRDAPLGSGLGHRLGSESNLPWIWSEARSDDVFARSFRYLIKDNYGAEPLYTPNADDMVDFAKGLQLLGELLPRSSRSALSHVQLIVIFAATSDTTPSSSSEFRLSGTIFLSRKLLASPWWVAEHLFHEALHQQLYDFRAGHSLLVPDVAREGAPRLCSLWNVPDATQGNLWDVHRAMAAFHVYVHLALLATAAEQRSPEVKDAHEAQYGPNRMIGSRTACARAQYLAEQVRLPIYWQELGAAGKRVMDWFESVLEALDPAPPPPGSYVHLILDRYWREAREIEILLRKAPRPDLSEPLASLAKNEVQSAHAVLAAARANVDVSVLGHALGTDEPGTVQFVRTRDVILESLLKASPYPDGYMLAESRVPDEMVKRMVDSSSESLQKLLSR